MILYYNLSYKHCRLSGSTVCAYIQCQISLYFLQTVYANNAISLSLLNGLNRQQTKPRICTIRVRTHISLQINFLFNFLAARQTQFKTRSPELLLAGQRFIRLWHTDGSKHIPQLQSLFLRSSSAGGGESVSVHLNTSSVKLPVPPGVFGKS